MSKPLGKDDAAEDVRKAFATFKADVAAFTKTTSTLEASWNSTKRTMASLKAFAAEAEAIACSAMLLRIPLQVVPQVVRQDVLA